MKPVFIFGGGAVGMALAVHLIHAGRDVRLVRTGKPPSLLLVRIENFQVSGICVEMCFSSGWQFLQDSEPH